jgi:DNA-binding transcriptional regulator YiaG
MATLAAALKSEVRRVAAGEVRKALRPLRKLLRQVKALKRAAGDHRRNLANVAGRLDRLKARVASRRGSGRGKGPRVSAESIRSFRSRVRMTREQFARLLGVSPGSIFGWETGRTTPRGKSAARFIEVRKMGVRKAKARAGAKPAGARRRRRAVRRRRAARKR